MKKKIVAITLAASMATYMLVGCDDAASLFGTSDETTSSEDNSSTLLTAEEQKISIEYKEDELVSYKVVDENGKEVASENYSTITSGYSFDVSDSTQISMSNENTIYLNGNSITYDGEGASVDGTTVTITNKGTYIITGTLTDGQIIVDADKDDDVEIILAGCNITCNNSACIYTKSSDKTVIVLADKTVNTLTDSTSYTYDDETNEEPNSCIFAKDDLAITGTGALVVYGNFNNGITSKDDLRILNGYINVTAANNGIKGKDSVVVKEGTIVVKAVGDGIKATNDEDSTKGYVYIDEGNILINSEEKGIKAVTNLIINNGNINVEDSYEGLESENIIINDGEIKVKSSDDGINAAASVKGGNENQEFNGETGDRNGGQMGGQMGGQSTGTLTINGGNIYVNADGDGLDSNGSITMSGGIVIVEGPTSSADGALDYDGSFNITGGTLFAVGAAGMAQAPGSDSTVNGIMTNITANSGSKVEITDSNGSAVFSYTLTKSIQNVVFCSDKLTTDDTYLINIDGSEATNFTASVILSNGGGMGNQGMPGENFQNKGEKPTGDFDGEMPSGDFNGETPPDWN